MRDFNYIEPSSIEEASRLLADLEDEEVRVVAGGTALMLTMRQRMVQPGHLISMARIERLHGIDFDSEKGLRIGSMTRHADLARSSIVRSHYPVLASMAARVANPQVRNQGTLGGNLCYADPSTDPPTCLLALDAQVVLGSVRGERIMPLSSFIVDYFETAIEPDELLVEIRVPPLPEGMSGVYSRFLRTAAEHRPLVSVAVVGQQNAHICHDVRIAVGASTPVPCRMPNVEALLKGNRIDFDLAERAAAQIAEDIEPLSDARGSAEFRRQMVRVVARRTICEVFGLGNLSGGNE